MHSSRKYYSDMPYHDPRQHTACYLRAVAVAVYLHMVDWLSSIADILLTIIIGIVNLLIVIVKYLQRILGGQRQSTQR